VTELFRSATGRGVEADGEWFGCDWFAALACRIVHSAAASRRRVRRTCLVGTITSTYPARAAPLQNAFPLGLSVDGVDAKSVLAKLRPL
jgi:hypothetical protein